MIKNYTDFISELLEAGFSVASSGNDEGVFSLLKQRADTAIQWHTGDPETDPWEWRMRVLSEHSGIAYSKVFFRKAGYITKEWYPYFLAARRGNRSFEEMYDDGIYSHYAKRIYELLQENDSLPLHEIKVLGGFGRTENSKFEKAMTDLQAGLFITMNGMRQKVSQKGVEYGWFSTVFCMAERFWDKDTFEKADDITAEKASEEIKKQILKLNPSADEKKINKFIKG